MPDFRAFVDKLNERLGQNAPPFVAWVDKLEKHCRAQDDKINALEQDAAAMGEKDGIIKGLEEEIAFLIEDILDVDRGIKTYEELAVDVRRRA